MWWIAVVGCSFTTFEYTPCEQSTDCRDAFGFGYACGDSGYCRPLAPLERCEKTFPSDLLTNPEYKDRIVVASVYDSAYDSLEEEASELAVYGVNNQGGLDDIQYGLVQCDYNVDGTYDNDDESTVMTNIGTWLAEEAGVPALIGSSTSSSTQVLYETTGEHGILMVSPSATSPALTLIDGIDHSDDAPGMLWRTIPSDAVQARAIAYDMAQRHVERVAVIAVDGAYGEGLSSAFIEAYTDGNPEITLYSYDEADDAVLGEHIGAVANLDYQEVLYVGSSVGSVIRFLNGASTLPRFENGEIRIFLTDSARYEQLFSDTIPEAQELFPLIRGTSPALASGPVYESFRAAFAAEYSGDSADGTIYTSHAFDAAWLVLYGTAWSYYQDGAITGFGMAKGLRQVSSGTRITVQSTNWNAVKANFEVGQSVDLEGASGEMDFDPATEETTKAVDFWTLDDRDRTFVNEGQFVDDI